MLTAFMRLKPEKQDIIIRAALHEFAYRGYALASTNEIVSSAGISKGALFHYFGDKKSLYLFLCSHITQTLESEYFLPVSRGGGDLLVRLRLAVERKMELLSRYPQLFSFCASLLQEESPEVTDEVSRFQRQAAESQHAALFEGLDDSLLKPEIPPYDGNRMLWWILEGYSSELSSRYRDVIPSGEELARSIAEFEDFLTQVRRIFYR